ncbi:hypothetical protein [Kitasatospora sp. NPDC005751]|uniref:hypothetical protein n=1 Tax=unclassified Kitasatospora TaxID=2633591 RepID=UPI0033CE5D04
MDVGDREAADGGDLLGVEDQQQAGDSALPEPPVLRFVQEQETRRPGESGLFRRRHLVFTAHLPDWLHHTVAAAEQDDPGRASVEWIPLPRGGQNH